MLSPASLAGWEDAVLASLCGATGTDEERDRQIERSGLYGEYPAILHGYQELFAVEEHRAEALKRAAFIIWRGATAAPSQTGIAPLPDGSVRQVIASLDSAARSRQVAGELHWMLAWYHYLSPDLFSLYGATPALLGSLAGEDGDAWKAVEIDPVTMRTRGQMGRYWGELFSRRR